MSNKMFWAIKSVPALPGKQYILLILSDFFIERQKSKTTFTFDDFSKIGTSNRLAGFVCKEALVSDEIKIDVRKTGVNIDPVKLPNLSDPNVKKSHPNLEL